MTTAATPPDAHGFMSLSLHAGATVGELHRAAADPDRLVIVEVNDQLPRTLGIPPQFPHALHVDEVDVIVRDDRAAVRARRRRARATSTARSPSSRAASSPTAARCRRGSAACRRRSSRCSPRDRAATTACTPRCSRPVSCACTRRARSRTRARASSDGISVSTFALGTAELYAWLDGNPDVRFLPVDVVNAPDVDRAQPPRRVDQRRARGRPLRTGRRRPARRAPVLGHRRARGLRRAVGARAQRPIADLPPVDRARVGRRDRVADRRDAARRARR